MIASALTPYKWAILAGGAVAIGAAAFCAGWAVQGWRMGAKLSDIEAKQSSQQAEEAIDTLNQFQQAARQISDAASNAQSQNATTAAIKQAIRQEMKNVKALPPGCVPDADRLRNRNAAIEAYNRAATGQLSGSAVQDDPAVGGTGLRRLDR